jgi:hypothetical protein
VGRQRRHESYRQEVTVTVEVKAPDAAEAARRIEDAADALNQRFTGVEIYRPWDGGPRRVAGNPTLGKFTVAPGRPALIDRLES